MKNNFLAMLTLHAEQVGVWAETLIYEVGSQLKNGAFKSDLIALRNATNRFNKTVEKQLGNAQLHQDTAANISNFCQMLAQSNGEKGGKLIEAMAFLAEHGEVVFQDNASNELIEKLTLISEMNDKLMLFKTADLKKISKQVLNTPTNGKI